MRHYLITRFNLRVPQWGKADKHGVPTLTPEWMEHRWELFQTHTVPSVIAQTNQQFTWLVLFDVGTVVKDGPYLPLYCTENWLRQLQRWLAERPMNWVITTRLDNDDTIEPEFIATIQANAGKKKEFINLPNGSVLRDVLRPIHHQANPFMSLVEAGDHPKSIYFMPHGRGMREHAPIKQVKAKRLWTQIIHERNYIND